jgi:hypothetical protein
MNKIINSVDTFFRSGMVYLFSGALVAASGLFVVFETDLPAGLGVANILLGGYIYASFC